ncbi:MAG: poly-gamma-glutamate biosynthesis protein PgsC/CapC [Kofleriaceae bacterium]
MFDHGVLNLFPPRGLDQSILVAVLVGIYVLLFLTEVFGWVWAGLVVPGYLASVFVIQPSSGFAICFEATLTFIACRTVSDIWSKAGGWSPFFGRERFFLIVLVSVLVRQACELYLLEDVMVGLEKISGLPLGHHQFSSIGLVLVPLLANMAWKLSLPRAVFQVGVTVVMTWAIVALIVLKFTNLSYSSLELTYENVALDFLGSPKAYIMLLTSSFIAARLNLSYGWDYNGILVPSLLALTWFDPRLTASTVIESLILVMITKAALSLPIVRRRNLEGPRKLVLVFTLGFLLKLLMGWIFVVWWPLMRLTDLFGFGYVLTSLIAVKMITLNKTGRVLLPSIAVSLVGFVVGSGVGFGLEQLAPRTPGYADAAPARVATSTRLTRSAVGIALAASVRARQEQSSREGSMITDAMLADYAALWRSIDGWLDDGGKPSTRITNLAERLGLRLVPLEENARGCWGLLDGQELLGSQRGWDTALLCPGSNGPVLEVVRPRSDRPMAHASVAICDRLQCAAVLYSGVEVVGGEQAMLSSAFLAAHRAVQDRPIVELAAAPELPQGKPRLHIRHALPDAVRVPVLWPDKVELTWDPPPNTNPLWQPAHPRVVLRVHPEDLLVQLGQVATRVLTVPELSVFGWVDQWRALSNTPPPPSQTELLVLEELVVAPLVELRGTHLGVIAAVARTLDHGLQWLPDGAGVGRGAWVLTGEDGRGWVALAVAARPELPIVVAAPRPYIETGTGRLAAATWQSSAAVALVLDPEWAARAPGADVDYGNPIVPGEVSTAFHAVHQALTRYLAHDPRGSIVEIRGFAMWRPIEQSVVVSLGTPLLDQSYIPPTIRQLMSRDGLLWQIGGAPHWVDGSETVAPLLGAGTPQLLYAQAIGVPFASVWVSPVLRHRALPQDSVEELRDHAAAVGTVLIEKPVGRALLEGVSPGPTVDAVRDEMAPALSLAFEYAETQDLATLAVLMRDRKTRVSLGWSPDLKLGYVLLEGRRGERVRRVAALMGSSASTVCATVSPIAGADVEVWRALQRWCLRIEVSGVVPP